MKTVTSIALLALLLIGGCQPSCPYKLIGEKDFEGEGFLVSQDPHNFMVVFVPACQINKQHYLQSLQKENLGNGITVPLYNFAYTLALMNPKKRFVLLNPADTLGYPLDGVFISPVRLHYKNLHHDSSVHNYPINFRLKEGEIIKTYIAASQEIDTLEFLPYAP